MADYHPLIARAVVGLEKNTGDARRGLYERARSALVAQLRAARVGQSRLELALITADLVLLTLIITVPNPFSKDSWPTAFQFRFDGFDYFFIFLASFSILTTARQSYDLKGGNGETDVNNAALAMTKVKLVYVELDTPAAAQSVQFGPASR